MDRTLASGWATGLAMLVAGLGCATANEVGDVPADSGAVSFGAGGAGVAGAGAGGYAPPGAGGYVPPGSGGTPVTAGGAPGAGGAAPCSSCTAPLNGTVVCNAGTCDFACNTGFTKSGTACARIVTCTDGMMNGSETDVDCGGATTCPRCAPGLACSADGDCKRGPCEPSGLCGCTPDTCEGALSCGAAFDDGCGGTLDCTGSCVAPAFCYQDLCCTAAVACSPSTCSPTFDDGCGGTLDCTTNCAATDVCVAEACCTPKTCDATTCGNTTDGCGTALQCPPCSDGSPCATGDDCQSTICTGGRCVSCTDGQLNNGETDIDCGGATCPKCASDKKCQNDSDCASDTCCGPFGPFGCITQPGDTCL